MNIHISKIFVLCMVIGVFGMGTAMAASSVTIDPASTTGLSPGDTFSVNINVDPDGNGVSGGQIDLSFDTTVLEVTSLTKGDMLGTDAFDIGSSYDNTAGTVIAVLARNGATTPPTAAGTWVTVAFQVKAGAADGTTNIAITSVGIVDGSFAAITGIATTGGTATVGTVVPSGPSVIIDPASTTGLSPGDTFSVNINVDPDGNGVSGGQIDLSFDTTVLEVTSLTKGDMLGTDAFDIGSSYDNTAGTVIAVLARNGATTPPTAAGTWVTVAFQVKAGAADGTTNIAITSVGIVDGSFAAITGIATTGGTATVGGAAAANIVINEFMANPSSGSEWVELYNKETTAVDIGGWQVDDIEGGSSPTTIPADTTIAAGGFYVVNLSSVLNNNGGDTVRLLDDAGALVDSYAYTSSTAGVSEGRTPDGADTWTTFDTPTPGASNGVGVNQPPTAVIASPTASGTYHVDEEVSFLSTGSTDTDGIIVSYSWTFGDGDTGTGVSATHTYTTAGSKIVTLTVTDDGGAIDTATVTINVLAAGEVSVTLYEGWNLIAVPVNDPDADTAAELASKIAGCKEVVMWDAAEDEYVTYTKIVDDWKGTDFAITGGMGIFVNVEDATTVGFTGDAWS